MRSKNIMGIVFSNTNDEKLSELTAARTIGSVPFGCRYRLIDFALSAIVNAGIYKVGVVTKRNYQSLMDHIGNGRPWDLARKNGGLSMLSPYGYAENGVYKGKIDALYGNLSYLECATEEYILMTDANVVANIDIEKMIDRHVKMQADITLAYKKGISGSIYLDLDEDGIITGVNTDSDATLLGRNVSLNILLLRRDLLIGLIKNAYRHNFTDFGVDVLQREVGNYKMYGYEITRHALVIDSIQSYFEANMRLLDKHVRDEVFDPQRPVYTKLRDDMPARYGFDAKICDSLIADGCMIEGEVKNSIIFRGVRIGKGAKVENCILMQSCQVDKNCSLGYIVADKNVHIKEGRTLMGYKSFPLVIGKGLTV